jgi:hypothetical protein
MFSVQEGTQFRQNALRMPLLGLCVKAIVRKTLSD